MCLIPLSFSSPPSRNTCYTNANGPDVFELCAPSWVSSYDRETDDYDGSYMSLSGISGCNIAEPPPSEESDICKSFHKEIAALRKKYEDGATELDQIDKDLRHFLKNPATESLLIPTTQIRCVIHLCSGGY